MSFVEDWFNLLLTSQLVLAHDLHGVEATGVFLPGEDHSAESSSSYDLNLLEIVPRDQVLLLRILSKGQFRKMCP